MTSVHTLYSSKDGLVMIGSLTCVEMVAEYQSTYMIEW